MKSMNSGPPASVALPDRSSFGIMRSTSTTMVAYSCGVKNVAVNGVGFSPAAARRAVCAAWAASAASAAVQVNPAARGTDPSSPSIERRLILVMLNRALLALVRDVVAGAHRQRQDRPRAVLVRLRHERAAIGDEYVARVVRLAVLVHDRSVRIVPHAGDAALVGDPPAGRPPALLRLMRHRRERRAAHLLDDRPEGLLHVLPLLPLVIAPLEVEAQDRNAVLVDDARIELQVRVLVRHHLASPREAHRRSVDAPVVALELVAVAAERNGRSRGLDAGIRLNVAHESRARHMAAPADFDGVAAREIELLVIHPPRHVQVHAPDALLAVQCAS